MADSESIWSGVLRAWGDMTSEARLTLLLVLFGAFGGWLSWQFVQNQAEHNAAMQGIFADYLESAAEHNARRVAAGEKFLEVFTDNSQAIIDAETELFRELKRLADK